MKNGIAGGPLPSGLPYGDVIELQADALDFSPVLTYAIKMNETSASDPPDVVSPDGGHGIMQLTSSYPKNWTDPAVNVGYAIEHFLIPAEAYWAGRGFQGDDLIRLIAATYNAGLGNAIAGHEAGNVDLYTTNGYAARCLEHYQGLVKPAAS